jgi:hypothetical protein
LTTISAALNDPALLQPYFAGDSWALWVAILRAAEGLPLSPEQLAAFREVAERDPPTSRIRELWCICGRRAGKDSIASAICTVAALGDYSPYLRPGEPAVIMCLACDRSQAAIVHKYISAYFKTVPLLQPLVSRETDDGLELVNNVEIIVSTNPFRSVRGRTIVACVFDEIGFWRLDDSASPDFEVYSAVEPGMATLPDAMLIGISSPYRRSGLLYRKFTESYGKPDDAVLIVRGESRRFNPTLPARIVTEALERDPEAARAEWLAQWRDDLADYIDRQIVEACVMSGVAEIPPSPGIVYSGFFDPAAGSGSDSATLAIGHADADSGAVIIDCLREWRPPFLPTSLVAEAAAVCHSYGVSRIFGDRFAGLWTASPFAAAGIVYDQSAAPKSDQYRDCLPLLNSQRLRLPDNRRLVSQFCALERQTTRSGRDSISEPRGAHDDLCNVVAGLAGIVTSTAAPALWCRADLMMTGRPIPWPTRAVQIFATAAVDGRGIFICYWAAGCDRYGGGAKLLLIDFEQKPFSPGLFDAVRTRIIDLAATPVAGSQGQPLPAAAPGGFICTIEIAPHATAAGLPSLADGTALLAPREALVLACAAQIGQGGVKVSDVAQATAHRLPLPLAEVRVDAPPSAAADAALLGIAAVLPREWMPRGWAA